MIGDIGKFFSGGTPSSSRKDFYGGAIPFIRSGEIHSDRTELFLTQDGYINSSAKMVEIGDILLALYGANSGDISISQICGAINQAILCIRTSVAPVFFKSVWEKHAKKILNTYLQGGQGNLSADIVKRIPISIPSQPEQVKISVLFSLLDERIAVQTKVIERYRSLIQALVQQTSHKNTQTVYLKEILKECKEQNSQGYDICSVSVSKGVVNQVEYLGRSFAAKETRHYNVVRHGDIVYTKSPTGDFPYGIVKQSFLDNPVAVSPLYGVYIPESYEIGVYLHYYFESAKNALNYLHKLIQKGAKNTINITNQHFLENTIKIPSAAYLTRLVSAILSVDSRIRSEESALLLYQQQKQYMLSSLVL